MTWRQGSFVPNFSATTCGTLSSNSDKVCAENWWWTYAFKRGGKQYSPMRWAQKYLPDVFGGIQVGFLRISVCQSVAISATKKLRFVKSWPGLSTELWMGNVAVKCSVTVYTVCIVAAEEICPHSSPAPTKGHTDGAVRKHGPHSCLKNICPMFTASCIWWHPSWVPEDFLLPKCGYFCYWKIAFREKHASSVCRIMNGKCRR